MRNHGNRSAYTRGCRCADCREANAVYARELRYRDQPRPPRRGEVRYPTGAAAVTCWCETEIVYVTLDDIAAGHTETCGRPNCRRPNPTGDT